LKLFEKYPSPIADFETSAKPHEKFRRFKCSKADHRIIPDRCDELKHLLSSALGDNLPADLLSGGDIKTGYDAQLDECHNLSANCRSWINDVERKEQSQTGIKCLKVKYNGALGYFIELTKSNLHLVPNYYIRCQTTVNAE
jgi:DNA mismatch repair protein MutS